MTKIITRIAPSPTGLFHIGTARTALFNYLFAKKNGGDFRLRLEDTDQARNHPDFEKDILEGLTWLGLNWDGQIIKQSERMEKYQFAAMKLVEESKAYEKDGAIWFKIPKDERLEFDDLVFGKISVATKDLKDFVILKSDRWPTFHLAVVCDDEEMGVTDIIRGDDHLTNTHSHVLLQKALGYRTPNYAHLPLILNPDRSKMSKRKDQVSISKDFRDRGYLPEAMVNFLAMLGWSPKTEQEAFSLSDLISNFEISGVQKSGAVFNIEKLNRVNQIYLQKLSNEELLELAKSLPTAEKLKRYDQAMLLKAVPIVRERLERADQLLESVEFLFDLPEYEGGLLVFKKSGPEKCKAGLEKAKSVLGDLTDWSQAEIKSSLQSIIETDGLAPGEVFWPVRVALSGLPGSPPPEQIAEVLGKDEAAIRFDIAINKINNID